MVSQIKNSKALIKSRVLVKHGKHLNDTIEFNFKVKKSQWCGASRHTHTHVQHAREQVNPQPRWIQEEYKRTRKERERQRQRGRGRGREERKDTRGKQGSDAGGSRCLDYRSQQELRLQGGRRPRSSCSSGRRQAGAPCPLPL